MCELREVSLPSVAGPIPKRMSAFIEEGLRRGKPIDCFYFVPSNSHVVYAVLSLLPRQRFCEWGSGIGIATGLAEMLGFDAIGIEIDARLASESRRLLADFGCSAPIETGSYFDVHCDADVYFTYCWPGQMRRVERHFLAATPDHATLLTCHGAEDIRCKVKPGP